MGLARPGRTNQQDVALLNSHIVQVGIGDDGIRGGPIPAIDETFEVVADAQGEASLGDGLPDDELIEVGDRVLGEGIEARSACLMVAQGAGLALEQVGE